MNINNLRKELEQGDTFTYKKLCEVLEEKPKSGNSKPKQLEDWSRYFEFEKDRTKIKILNIRDEVLPDIEKVLKKSKYYNDLETIILYGLKENNGFLRLSKSKALLFTNMVNKNYFISARNEPATSKMTGVDLKFIEAFRNLSSNKLKQIFDRNLKTMKDKALIMVDEVTVICKKEVVSKTISEDREEILETKQIFKVATKEEKDFILDIENETLRILGYEKKSFCFLDGKWNTYMAIVSKRLQKYNIEYYYSAYEITSSQKIINKTINKKQDEIAKLSLNEQVSTSLISSKDKTINNEEMREKLVDILISNNPSIDLMSNFLDVKETYDMIDFDVLN